jgi:hypothetical protein
MDKESARNKKGMHLKSGLVTVGNSLLVARTGRGSGVG